MVGVVLTGKQTVNRLPQGTRSACRGRSLVSHWESPEDLQPVIPEGVGAALFCGEGGLVLGTETTFERVSGHRSPTLVAHDCLPHARPCPLLGLEFQLLEIDQGPPRPPRPRSWTVGHGEGGYCVIILS